MEITKEKKEKLLKAVSEEEVRAILGKDAEEEQVARIWNEIRNHRNLEKLDDDELEAVSGGAGRDFLQDGCSDTVNDSWCWLNDMCSNIYITYSNYCEPCPKGGDHDWTVEVHYDRYAAGQAEEWTCTKCGKTKTVSY